MRFALLIYSDEANYNGVTEERTQENMGHWFAYTEGLRKSGKLLAGEALMPTATAHTVQVRSADTAITDGPFAETKEQFGGFYVLEADSWEEAAEAAKTMPILGGGSVEIRPLMEFEQS